MVWTVLMQHVSTFDPALLDVAFVFLLLGYGTKVGLAPLHAWLPDAHAKDRRRSRRFSPGCSSTSRSTRCCASSCCWPPIRERWRRGGC
ncbi:MAG: proton-conducting transporter membrane subunit [Bauldia sp.]